MERSRLALVWIISLVLLQGAAAVAAPAAAFDPGEIAATAGDPAFNTTAASAFRVALQDNLQACAWPYCAVNRSDEVRITVNGSSRITGNGAETYRILVSNVSSFNESYTTIAVVLKGNTTGVVMSVDDNSERAGDIAYTKNLAGSSTMNVTLLGPNQTGNLRLYVFAYVGNGNRSTHAQQEVYNTAVKDIEMRPVRTIPLNATVANNANVSVKNVLVSFYVKGGNTTEFALVGNASVAAIGPQGQAETGVSWDATWAEPTVYTVKVVIDPLHALPEGSEENNVHFYQVNLGTPEASQKEAQIGSAFAYGVPILIIFVAFGIYWYNRTYE